jgi:hypothetical protein
MEPQQRKVTSKLMFEPMCQGAVITNNKIKSLTVIPAAYVFVFLAVSFQNHPPLNAKPVFQKDTSKHDEPFGMRLRALPPKNSQVHAPVFVRESPGNEATLVKLADGTLQIYYINRPGDADKLMFISSKDGGFSWDNPRIAFTLPGQAYYANQVLADRNGELHCVFHLFDKGENGYRGRHLNLWYCRTENQQQRWTEPRKIFDGYVGSLRSLAQLENGRLLMAFAKAVPERSEPPTDGSPDYGWNDIISMFSDDNGNTWHFSENRLKIAADKPNNTRYGGVEPALTELRDGRIWMLIRTRLGHLYESYSVDAGTSWQSPKRTNFISSDSPATTVRLSDGRLVVFWCGNQRWDDPKSYAMGGREVLHAAISDDEAQTWKGFREVLVVSASGSKKGDRGTSYPSAVETGDGKLAIVAGQGDAQRAVVLFDPAWLEEKSQTDDLSEGLDQWTMFGSDSLCSSRNTTGKKPTVLRIRKSQSHVHHDTQAVWNFPMEAQGELEIEIVKTESSRGIHLALTDHFSICADTAASQNAVAAFDLTQGDADELWQRGKGKMQIQIRWNTRDQRVMLSINGIQAADLPFRRKPHFGVNYLRIGIPASIVDTSGFLLQSISVHAEIKR